MDAEIDIETLKNMFAQDGLLGRGGQQARPAGAAQGAAGAGAAAQAGAAAGQAQVQKK